MLDRLVAWGELRPLDARLARMLGARGGEGDVRVLLAAALASRAARAGDVCIELSGLAGRRFEPAPRRSREAGAADTFGDDAAVVCPPEAQWRTALEVSPLVGVDGSRPLVLDAAARVYLQRYWHYERRVAAALIARAAQPDDVADPARAQRALRRWFLPAAAATAEPGRLDRQAQAAALVARRRLVVITGGPGTGKTTTLARTVAMLAELNAGKRLRIGIAAPTGKGANRVQAALREALGALDADPAARGLLPAPAVTLHRLLGARRGASSFRHDGARPLGLDVLFVDEASMIDLRLMAHLLDAVPPGAKLVLLGDPDQLASVEAGAVLEEICRACAGGALGQLHVVLDERYRFADRDGIGRLADAVRVGDAAGALSLLQRSPGLRLRPFDGVAEEDLIAAAVAGYRPYLESVPEGAAAEDALVALARFQLLSPFRHGWFGTEHLNRLLERHVRGPGRDGVALGYPGQPVIVVRNDYDAGLFNGDVGVVRASGPAGALRAHFPAMAGGGDGTRAFSLARLPACEPAFALTVHKSQGSEFDRVMLVIPERERAGEETRVTRELVYTAISRARCEVEIWASERALAQAIAARARRASGLADALMTGGPGIERG